MKFKRFVSVCLLGAMSVGILSGCGAFNDVATVDDEGGITLSIAYNDQSESVTGLLASDFAERLEKLSGRKMTVNGYPSGLPGRFRNRLSECLGKPGIERSGKPDDLSPRGQGDPAGFDYARKPRYAGSVQSELPAV